MYSDRASNWLKLVDEESGLYNRIYLIHYLTESFSRACRYGGPISCILFHAKWWRGVDDLRQEGCVLSGAVQELANFLLLNVRSGDILGRWARDEFLLVASGTPRKGLTALIEIISAKAEEFRFDCLPGMTAMIRAGIAGLPEDKRNIRHAEAMPILARERLRPCSRPGIFRKTAPLPLLYPAKRSAPREGRLSLPSSAGGSPGQNPLLSSTRRAPPPRETPKRSRASKCRRSDGPRSGAPPPGRILRK